MMKVNWPQAFAEIGLLVIGGALALGGDAWMDSRRDLEAEHAYLAALRRFGGIFELLAGELRRFQR